MMEEHSPPATLPRGLIHCLDLATHLQGNQDRYTWGQHHEQEVSTSWTVEMLEVKKPWISCLEKQGVEVERPIRYRN
jgi:hypothetical protein